LAAEIVDVQGLILDLIKERASCGRSDIPLIFIGHSFGGTVLKQIYNSTHPNNSSSEEEHLLHHLIRGYVFLGTPHNNFHVSDFGDISKLWRAIASSGSVSSRSSTLERALHSVLKINFDFNTLEGKNVPSICFYETDKTYVGTKQQYIVTKQQATMPSQSIQPMPLDLKHQDLGIYEDEDDNNLLRVLKSFKSLMSIAQEPVVRQQRVTTRRLRILSLDGGGVKGLFSILVLQRLIDEAQKLEGNTSGRKRPCDYFDLIGGTSTGGLLAIMLGRLEMHAGECVQAYRSLAKSIFSQHPILTLVQPLPYFISGALSLPLYSGEKLKECVRDTVKQNLPFSEKQQLGPSVEDARLLSTQPDSPRCFVCAVPRGQHKVERIRSYRSIDLAARNTGAYKIWEAARATSAAPMYFSKAEVGGQTYFDGGLDSNNPVVEVIEEARQEFPGAVIDAVISIGTGQSSVPDPDSARNTLMHFIYRATNTEPQHQRVLKEPGFCDLLPGYTRFQGGSELGDTDLAAYDKMDEIARLAEDYLSSPDGKRKIANCASRIAGHSRT
jgi:predicted acylesterase/phospholipase RssA